MNSNSYSELEHLELVTGRIANSGKDLTANYGDWINVTFACASLGEAARECYHTICSLYSGYRREECDEKFTNCLKTGNGSVTLGTLMKMASDAGIDTSLPRGRRRRTTQQKQEADENRILQMRKALTEQAEWRFNVWRQRPEVKEKGQGWRPVQDRDLDTFYCRMREQGLNVKQQDVRALIYSRDFCTDFDVFRSWLESLKPWNPDTDPDYLHDFYVGHLEFGDAENEAFYDQMLKKWHVGMVALMLGRIQENPQMPIFKGLQHIGKTYFVRHILPPELSDYRLEAGPSERIDKDFIISLSETPLILFDEISFGSNQKNEAFKYIVTSSRSNVRDAYAHFRETRERRASLVATTNEDRFIRDVQGNRRYLVVDLKGTVDLEAFPLPYEGAYAQALYLLEHGFNPKPTQEESQLISNHNASYMEANDCEEVLESIIRQPAEREQPEGYLAGELMQLVNGKGFRGREFSAAAIGKAMRRMGFEPVRTSKGMRYLVVVKDFTAIQEERRQAIYAEGEEPF